MSGVVSEISSTTGISRSSCHRIAKTAFLRYKIFELRKKNGGSRTVAQPAREVKAVQRAICDILSPQLIVHPLATAYKKNSSILINASMHAGCRFLTKLDFKDFFGSINAATLARVLKSSCEDMTDAEILFIINSCTWRPNAEKVLCIGAPSSPLLANAAMYLLDSSINEAMLPLDVRYSRYSDDISISCNSPDALVEAENIIRKLVRDCTHPRLSFNEDKRVAVGRSTSMTVTGLTLTNQGGVSVGRERKRGVRAGVLRFLSGKMPDEEAIRLKGELAFVLSVEPDFRKVLINTYGASAYRILPKQSK